MYYVYSLLLLITISSYKIMARFPSVLLDFLSITVSYYILFDDKWTV